MLRPRTAIRNPPPARPYTLSLHDALPISKIVPEELAPVQPIGKLTLNRNPRNYFAETEQVAFHPGNLVPGRSEEHTSELQSRGHLVCRLLLEKKKGHRRPTCNQRKK